MPDNDSTGKVIVLESDHGTLFTGTVSQNNGAFKESWEYSRKNGLTGKMKGAYVSSERIISFQEAYKKCLSQGENRSSEGYKKRLVDLVSIEADKYSGDKGFVLQIVKKSDGYYIIGHKVHRYNGKNPNSDIEDIVFDVVKGEDNSSDYELAPVETREQVTKPAQPKKPSTATYKTTKPASPTSPAATKTPGKNGSVTKPVTKPKAVSSSPSSASSAEDALRKISGKK